MQEKEIKEKLNQELDSMAPDILDKILLNPIEPVESEEELFKNEPLFEEDTKKGKYLWIPQVVGVVACLAIVAIFSYMWFKPNMKPTTAPVVASAFKITIDVNPSFTIKVNKDGIVEKIQASNKDAKKIAKKLNEKIDEDTSYEEAMKLVVSSLKKNGYLKKDKSAMLVSVVSEDKKMGKEKLNDIKNYTKKIKKDKKVKCATIYQNCESNEKTKKIAKENNVSEGKASLCIKLAKKEKSSVKKMCKKSIYKLVKTAEKNNIYKEPDIEIEDDENLIMEEETTTLEGETISETTDEYIDESTSETTTVDMDNLENETTENVTNAEPETIPETASARQS